MKYLGIFLIVAGVLTTIYTSTIGLKSNEHHQATESAEQAPFQWWPIMGLVISAVGGTVVWFDSKKKKNSVRISPSKEQNLNTPQ
jgi:hypothetical protein